MQKAGDAMIGFQPLQGLPNFFRIVFPSAWTVSTADLDALMTRIEAFGHKLFSNCETRVFECPFLCSTHASKGHSSSMMTPHM